MATQQPNDEVSVGGSSSDGIPINGFMFTAGLGPQDPYTGEIVGEDVGEQTRLNTPCITGAFTATEALKGWQAGASAVKLFPASLLGPEVISAFSAPLPDIPLIPMGGVSIGEASRWLRAGALAVGIGSPLLGDALTGGSLPDLRERARTLRAAVDGDGGRSGTLERDNLATLEGA